jgi:hypothetical protein
MRGQLAIGILVLALAGCGGGVRPCKSGTLLLTLTLAPAAATATALTVDVVAGTEKLTTTVERAAFPASGSLEIDFGGRYPAGQSVRVDVTATRGEVTLASGSRQLRVADKCEALSLDLVGAAPDPGFADAAAPPDLGATDAAPPADLLAPPADLASCAATSASADHFVDAVLGTDDARHGGGSGACAYKTVAYALTQAQARIVLVPGQTYSGPFTLASAQSLDGDPTGSGQATLTAPTQFGGGAIVTIAASAAGNTLRNLIVDGGGNQIDCVDVLSAGGATIERAELRGCTFAVKAKPGADKVAVTSSSIHDVGWGVDLQGGMGHSIRQNRISANPYSVLCAYDNAAMTPLAGASGCGNSLVMGECNGCGACTALLASCI